MITMMHDVSASSYYPSPSNLISGLPRWQDWQQTITTTRDVTAQYGCQFYPIRRCSAFVAMMDDAIWLACQTTVYLSWQTPSPQSDHFAAIGTSRDAPLPSLLAGHPLSRVRAGPMSRRCIPYTDIAWSKFWNSHIRDSCGHHT